MTTKPSPLWGKNLPPKIKPAASRGKTLPLNKKGKVIEESEEERDDKTDKSEDEDDPMTSEKEESDEESVHSDTPLFDKDSHTLPDNIHRWRKRPKKYVPDVKPPKWTKSNTDRVSETNPLLMQQPLTRGKDVFPAYAKQFAITDTSYELFLQNVLHYKKASWERIKKMRRQQKDGSMTYCNVLISNMN